MISNRNRCQRWTKSQDKIISMTWIGLGIRSLLVGRTDNAIINRLYKTNKKTNSFREAPLDYVEDDK